MKMKRPMQNPKKRTRKTNMGNLRAKKVMQKMRIAMEKMKRIMLLTLMVIPSPKTNLGKTIYNYHKP